MLKGFVFYLFLFVSVLSFAAHGEVIFCGIGKKLERGVVISKDSRGTPQIVLEEQRLSACSEEAVDIYVCSYQGMKVSFNLRESLMKVEKAYEFKLRDCRNI